MSSISKIEKAANGAANKVRSGYEDAKASVQSEYPEVSEIREDLRALKQDVVKLGSHVQSNSGQYVRDVKDYAWDKMERGMETVERRVQDKPGQTLLAAFAAGLFASFFFGRR